MRETVTVGVPVVVRLPLKLSAGDIDALAVASLLNVGRDERVAVPVPLGDAEVVAVGATLPLPAAERVTHMLPLATTLR